MYIRRIHYDRVVGDELVVRDDAFASQIGQNTLEYGIGVDERVARIADLNVEAESLGVEDVVVKSDTIEDRPAIRIVHPMDVAGALAVEAEIEDEYLVPRERRGIVWNPDHGDQPVERCGRNHAPVPD